MASALAMKGLVFLLAMVPSLLFAQTVSFFPHDDTEATGKHRVPGLKDEEMRLAPEQLFPAFLCGVYCGPNTDGYALYLFPDGTVKLGLGSDVSPETLVGEGRWTAEPKRVGIDWKWMRFAGPRQKSLFARRYGDCRAMELYLTFTNGMTLGHVLLVSGEFSSDVKIDRYFERRHEFPNWEKTRDGLQIQNGRALTGTETGTLH